jgi:excisionase family DNA binding protein
MAKKAIKSKNDDRMDTFLTMREACQVLRVHSNTLRRWSKAGLVKEYRIGVGHHRRFRRGDIDALLVEHHS